jgi:hypothetical protein
MYPNNNTYNSYQTWIPPNYSAPPPASNVTSHSRPRVNGVVSTTGPVLPRAISHLQQQAQQSNLLAAAAAASMSSVLNTHTQQQQSQDRTMISYNDIALSNYSSAPPWAPDPGFYCSTCNKRFQKESSYQSHMNSHAICPHCSFSASATVVDEHTESIHGMVKHNKLYVSSRSMWFIMP